MKFWEPGRGPGAGNLGINLGGEEEELPLPFGAPFSAAAAAAPLPGGGPPKLFTFDLPKSEVAESEASFCLASSDFFFSIHDSTWAYSEDIASSPSSQLERV